MNLVAVETSGRNGTIALLQDGLDPITKNLGSDGKRHAQTLVSDADALLRDHGLEAKDTTCVAVSLGPGSFTGLRVGIVFAKTFGWLNKCPIVSVPTLKAVALATPPSAEHICVISDAQRGEVFVAEFQREGHLIQSLADVRIATLDETRSLLKPETTLTGPALTKYEDELAGFCPLAPKPKWQPSAHHVALLGQMAFENGDIADPWKLEPFYLRRSAAEEKRDAGQH